MNITGQNKKGAKYIQTLMLTKVFVLTQLRVFSSSCVVELNIIFKCFIEVYPFAFSLQNILSFKQIKKQKMICLS